MTRLERIKQQIAEDSYDPDGRKLGIAEREMASAARLYYDLCRHGYDRRRAESVMRHSTGWSRERIREEVDRFEGTA